MRTKIANVADFRRVVRFGETPEGLQLEFKRDLNAWAAKDAAQRANGRKEFCRDVCQFANTNGGTLLIGVDEIDRDGVRVASGIHPLDDCDDRRGWMQQAISQFLVPATLPVTIEPLTLPEGRIIVVTIPASERVVTVWDKDEGTIECLRRTNHGKEYLNPTQMQELMLNTGRISKLALDRVRAEVQGEDVELASGVWVRESDGRYRRFPEMSIRMRRFDSESVLDEHDFELVLALPDSQGLTCLRVPYGLLREAWVTSDRKIGLFLHARVLFVWDQNGSGRLTLEPF